MTWLVKALADPSDLSLVPEMNVTEGELFSDSAHACHTHPYTHTPTTHTHTNVFLKVKGVYTINYDNILFDSLVI